MTSRPVMYYQDSHCTIYHGDCLDIIPHLEPVDLVLTDPPYGVEYSSSWENKFKGVNIHGDGSTGARDAALSMHHGPALVFGSWKQPRPVTTKTVLTWDKGTVGMGDLSLPWFPCTEEIYVIGSGWTGTRTSAVMRHVVRNTYHPTEKPVPLIKELLVKSTAQTILDPFMGSGTTLVAAKELGRKAIGIEISKEYCDIAVKRLRQEVLF